MRLDATEREQLIRKYAEGPARLSQALAMVPEAARKWRPAQNEWSAHEIVCHCADSETNAAARIRYVGAERAAVIRGYDENAWAFRFDYHTPPLEATRPRV